MLDKVARALGDWIEQLSPTEQEAFGIVLSACPQCEGSLEEGWLLSSEKISFLAGRWSEPPKAWKGYQQAQGLRSAFRLRHLVSYLGPNFLAAARCPRCRLVLLKYE